MGFFDDIENALDGFENLVNRAADAVEHGAAKVEKSVNTTERMLNKAADTVDHKSKLIEDHANRILKASEKLAPPTDKPHSVDVQDDDTSSK